ncbi:MAG: hypothetical protein IPG51_12135 [Chloroflexi bacterium]|nr:hypothetical protein [Chloroflexota bacterium]
MANCKSCNDHSPTELCVACELDQMARNHYFTGKLLVERDFVDEQHYHMGKARRHNQYQHGWGTACGLKVVQHPNRTCRSQYVVVQPGQAIDCCGREILLRQEQYFDFRARFRALWQEKYGKDVEPDDKPHDLQVCIRYVECPTEEVPALFDDCGCDDTAVQPNRILETTEFDLVIDPEETAVPDPAGVKLDWLTTLNVQHASRVVVDEDRERIFVLTSEEPFTLYVFDQDHHCLLASYTGALPGWDMALSPDGSRLYISQGANDTEVSVLALDTAVLETANPPEVNTLAIDGAASDGVQLIVAGNGRLYALNISAAQLWAWDAPDTDTTAERFGPIATGAAPWGLALAPDDSLLFVANSGAANVGVYDTANLATAPALIDVTGAAPYALAIAQTTADLKLFVADRTNKTMRIFAVRPADPTPYPLLGGPVNLLDHPLDLVVSSGGRWLYAFVADSADQGAIQVIDTHAIETGDPDYLGARTAVGPAPRNLQLTKSGRIFYAAFNGLPTDPLCGGVAILSLLEMACGDIFKHILEPCPACADDSHHCVVLATVKDYVYGNQIIDEPESGTANPGEVMLDNWTDRHILPSTTLLYEVIQCLLAQGGHAGEPGEQGPPGPAGTAGR